MLNRMLIKQIMNKLLDDIFSQYDTIYAYQIKNKKTFFEIVITAYINKDHSTLSKYKTVRIKSWVELIIGYNFWKEKIKIALVDNIKEEIC